MIHTNVRGKLLISSLGGSIYIVTFIGDHSRHSLIYAINSYTDVFSAFCKGHSIVNWQTGREPKALDPENGGEYPSTKMNYK